MHATGSGQEAGIEAAHLTFQHLVDAGLEVVVDPLMRYAAPVMKRRIVGGKDHFLGLAGEHHDEGLPTVGEAKVGSFNPLHHTADLHFLLAPVKLVNLPGSKQQGDKGCRLGG